jgi:hypothetical protein
MTDFEKRVLDYLSEISKELTTIATSQSQSVKAQELPEGIFITQAEQLEDMITSSPDSSVDVLLIDPMLLS